jgi:anti-anti-sigma factor
MSDDRQLLTVTARDERLELVGELDAASVAVLNAALASRNSKGATLDLSGLTFIDSMGLHAIVDYAKSHDVTVTVTGASTHILRVFEITRLTEHPNLRVNGTA